MLSLLPDLTFPVTVHQIEAVMNNLKQLNVLDAGVNDRCQRALGINFHIFDTWIKSKGKVDYRGKDGHLRLMQDAKTYCGATAIVTRHGDLPAAHLAIDYHDTQIRLREAGQEALPSSVNDLLAMSTTFRAMPPKAQDVISLYLDCLGKKPHPNP